jgi:fido (protein-threonine AMPylation protein)
VILFEITGSEAHESYQELEIANGNRQYDFLRSMVAIAIKLKRPFLSQQVIKALNYHAIACLNTNAGEFRPCHVEVGTHRPPAPHKVQALMDDFTNTVNLNYHQSDPVVLAAYVLWRLNNIHPFINGNGRTARAACYFILCVKSEGWLGGSRILPELLRESRAEYVVALQAADESAINGEVNLAPLHGLLQKLLTLQMTDPENKSVVSAEEKSPIYGPKNLSA